ncbi:MAG: hypothetical protein ACRDT2_14335 [Natronosporangium sp.]
MEHRIVGRVAGQLGSPVELSSAELRTVLVALIQARRPAHALRVAIDGPDAAGKTTLADALAADLAGHRPVIRMAAPDGWQTGGRAGPRLLDSDP